ncbi:MAG: AAA family ATPase [Lachnospiraceae bacterium]|nr:AAA family ATPase [Lachnospiraceae bacterium]
MTNKIIYIYGASGSGTTTLRKYISEKLNYTFMDTDDYFWKPINPPYKEKRNISERLELMKKDIEKSDKVIISGSLVDWGDELIPLFTFVIRLNTATDIRVQRLKRREYEHFGSRIEIGGDMFEEHQKFLAWAAAYAHEDINMRSKAKHDKWQKLLQCKQITLDGSIDVKDNFEIIKSYL